MKNLHDTDDVAKAEAVHRGTGISGPEIATVEPPDLLGEFDAETVKAAEAQMKEVIETTPFSEIAAGPHDVPGKLSHLPPSASAKHGWGGSAPSRSASVARMNPRLLFHCPTLQLRRRRCLHNDAPRSGFASAPDLFSWQMLPVRHTSASGICNKSPVILPLYENRLSKIQLQDKLSRTICDIDSTTVNKLGYDGTETYLHTGSRYRWLQPSN